MDIWKALRAFAVAGLFAVGACAVASAQGTPTPPPYSILGGAVSLAVTSSSGRVILPANAVPFGAITIYNHTSVDAFYALGSSTVVATTSSIPVRANTSQTIWVGTNTYLAAITASSTANLDIYQATGPIQLALLGGTTGGGGGGNPGGSAGQVQYQVNGTTFGGISGATTDGTTLTLVAPVLGTIASGNLAAGTGYTVANLSGAGTGALTALGVNVGSAGAFVTNGGALGTPSSGNGSNITALAAANITGTLGLTHGGTGTGTAGVAALTAVGALTGTASSSTFLRGDGSWATVTGAPCTSTALSVQYNAAGSFGCISGLTSNGTLLTIASGDLHLSGSSSGTSTLNAPATGGGTATLFAGTDTIAGLATAQTFTAVQTFTNDDVRLLGSSTGYLQLHSLNAGASNFTISFPAVTDTVAFAGIGAVISTNGTTTSPTAAQFNNNCPLYTVDATTAVFNIPSAASIGSGAAGCIMILNWSANTYTLTPNGADQLCQGGGSCANSSATEPGNSITLVTSNGTKDYANVQQAGGSFTGGTVSGATSFTANAASGVPGLNVTGTPFSGTGTTSRAAFEINESTATASTARTADTSFFINRHGSSGLIMDLQEDGTSFLSLNGFGALTANKYFVNTSIVLFGGNGSTILSAVDGNVELTNNAVSGFTTLQLGGTTSTFGGLKTNGAETDSELADASAVAPFGASAFISRGPTATLTGTCTTGTKIGFEQSMTFVATCTAQTIIATFGFTAPHGWLCQFTDLTTGADALPQTAASTTSTTSCTASGTTAASDLVKLIATPFLVDPLMVGFQPANENSLPKGQRATY